MRLGSLVCGLLISIIYLTDFLYLQRGLESRPGREILYIRCTHISAVLCLLYVNPLEKFRSKENFPNFPFQIFGWGLRAGYIITRVVKTVINSHQNSNQLKIDARESLRVGGQTRARVATPSVDCNGRQSAICQTKTLNGRSILFCTDMLT